MAAASKKAVTHQQLYGSNRCLRQASVHYPLEHSGTLKRSQCAGASAGLPHSRSITALQNVDLYGSYVTLPSAAGALDQVPQRSYCARHLPSGSGVGGGGGGSHTWHPPNHYAPCCHLYAPTTATPTPACLYSGAHTCHQHQHQQPQQQQYTTRPPLMHDSHKPLVGNGCYFGYEHGTHLTDEEDSAFPGFHDREFHLLHRNIPALRRTGVDTAGIRQYFYPDGGWGWIICGIAFLVHILTTGLQMSSGLLLFYAIQHLRDSNGIEWLGAVNWAISMLLTPFVVTFCRKKSTRLMAVVGGLVLPLGILFTSFATELGQIFFSYGVVFGAGVAMVRESSTIMLGNYFKRRRQFVEMIAMSGEGVGIALFSVILREGVGNAGWRVGLQIIAGLVAVSFFIGLLYRPASLYHPQRRAIQHLKNQRKKMRENKTKTLVATEQNTAKYFFLDISPFKSTTVKILLMTAAVAALGIYTPMLSVSLNAAKEGSDNQDLVLLQTFLGVSTTLGIFIAGTLLRRPLRIRTYVVNTQVVSQGFIFVVALAILFLSFVMSYRGLCILCWIYGIGFGGFRYALKILALERIKTKQFTKAWGLLKGIEAIPVLISVPLTIFLNDYSLKYGRAGYYICSAAAAIAGIIIFFINYSNLEQSSCAAANKKHGNGTIPTLRPPAPYCKLHGAHEPLAALDYAYHGCDYPAPDLLNRSCVSLNQVDFENICRNTYCDRWRMPSVQKLPCAVHSAAERRAAGHSHGAAAVAQTHYEPEQRYASMGRMGKRLQKSLSFIQNPYCCNGQWHCNCHDSYQWTPASPSRSQLRQPLLCTCHSGSSNYLQNSRSRSVPEGLSTIAQQCSCKAAAGVDHTTPAGAAAALSREIIYLPRHGNQLHDFDYDFTCRHNQRGHHIGAAAAAAAQHGAATTPRYRHKRSQSLSKPIHYVEQITTSV